MSASAETAIFPGYFDRLRSFLDDPINVADPLRTLAFLRCTIEDEFLVLEECRECQRDRVSAPKSMKKTMKKTMKKAMKKAMRRATMKKAMRR